MHMHMFGLRSLKDGASHNAVRSRATIPLCSVLAINKLSLSPSVYPYEPLLTLCFDTTMEKSVTEQEREIKDVVKRADKNLDRNGPFVSSRHALCLP